MIDKNEQTQQNSVQFTSPVIASSSPALVHPIALCANNFMLNLKFEIQLKKKTTAWHNHAKQQKINIIYNL